MNIPRFLPALLAALLVSPAWAQSTGKPLNLKLPPGELPAASGTAAAPARDAPGVYYGDTSGRMGNADVASDDRPDCDDSTYNQAQMHGSVGMGVMGGNHMSGNYQTGTVNISKAFGSCDEPSGGISISVGAGSGHFHDHGRRDH
ncbi:MAG: hypothetical protein ACYC0F_17975 [Rhodanobacter sp.]